MSLLIVMIGFAVAAVGATLSVALVMASRLELTRWVARRLAGADAALTTLARPGDVVSVGNALVGMGVVVAGVAAPWALRDARMATTLALELVLGLPLIALLVYFLPRAVGRRWPEAVVRHLVPRLRPASALVGRIVRGRAATEQAELAALFRDSTSEGLAREDELEIVTGVMAFTSRVLHEVMTPRTRVEALPESASAREIAQLVVTSGFTRIPVYRDSLDEITGMVHAFDLLKAGDGGAPRVRPVSVFPATRRCADALLDLKREQRHLAVVVDEFGGTAGIVTMEDLLEELVGEIFDEHDEPSAVPAATGTPTVLVVDAGVPLADVADHFGVDLGASVRIETVGGFASALAGRIPQPGDRLASHGLEFDILEGTPQRVGRLVIRRATVGRP